MQPEGGVTAEGFVSVTPGTGYTSERGYGWEVAPSQSFDSVNLKYYNALLSDGVLASDSLVFKADVPNGDYFLTVSLGGKDKQPLKMQLVVNGEILEDSLVTAVYRLTHKSCRRKLRVQGNSIRISLASLSTPVGLHGIELRAATDMKRIPFKQDPKEDTAVVTQFTIDLEEARDRDPGNIAIRNQLDMVNKYLLACDYYNGGGWLWATKSSGLSLIHRLYAAADLLEQVCADPEDPLYYKAVYLLGKIHYWLNEEDGDAYHEQQLKKYFGLLQPILPDDPVLKMYLGEQIPHPMPQSPAVADAPLWAVYQQETMRRMLSLIHWWVTVRQAPNGEMGGKYGDDVELLRWWLPAILGADDSTARLGYQRLADGVWNSGLLERGFSRQVDDVEHSAELFRDTHPGMFMINYGDPEYVERSMLSMQNFRDVWTGITPRGHRHFKSYYMSATEVLDQPPYGVDIPLNARAALPGLWAAWYNGNPTILKLFTEWATAWIEDAERTGNSKPRGIIPAAVSFKDDRIGGYSPEWYDPHLTYSYYKWESLGHVSELYYQLAGMYGITGNKYFLQPVNDIAGIMTEARKEGAGPQVMQKGSLDWAKKILMDGGVDKTSGNNPLGKVFALAKRLTGSVAYDTLIAAYGQPYNRYLLTGDKDELVKAMEQPLQALRYNYPLLTSEVKFTDRVYVPGSEVLAGMYNGHFGRGYEYPALIASWKNTGTDVAVLVRKGNRTAAEVSLFNFGTEKYVTMNTWQLEPGVYRIKTGIDKDDDDRIDQLVEEKEMVLNNRVNRIDIKVSSKKLTIVSIEQIKSVGTFSLNKPDLALTKKDISFTPDNLVSGTELAITGKIHNIGNRAANNITAAFLVDGITMDSTRIAVIESPDDLNPRWKPVQFKWKAEAGKHQLAVKVYSDQQELTYDNNQAYFDIEITGR